MSAALDAFRSHTVPEAQSRLMSIKQAYEIADLLKRVARLEGDVLSLRQEIANLKVPQNRERATLKLPRSQRENG